AVVVDVGERRGDADPARHADARLASDVRKAAAAGVLPELVSADLVDEVDVVEAVAVDIGYGDAGAMVVVDRFVVEAGILDDVVHEGDTAVLQPVGELKV